jgi:hypothetical protein
MSKIFSASIFTVSFFVCLNIMGQSAQSKLIHLSSTATINYENRVEDINKLFDDLNQKIKSANDNRRLNFNYTKPQFNFINQNELEISVELETNNEPFQYNYKYLARLEFIPSKFSNQADLNKNLEMLKREMINKLKNNPKFNIIQEDPLTFKGNDNLDYKEGQIEFSHSNEYINLTRLFPNHSISNLEENTLIYNVLSSSATIKQTVSKPSEFDAFLSHFNPSDKLFIKKILNMNQDPYNKLFSVCGKGVRKCKWCGKNYVFDKLYKSMISHVQSLLSSHVENFNYDEKNILKQVKYLRPFINEIKSGKYYFCEEDIFSTEGKGYCSKKCESEFR